MKNIVYYCCVILLLINTACNNTLTEEIEKSEYVEVGFDFKIEGVPMEVMQEDGAQKSSSTDLYAVQVYSALNESAMLNYYAYGLFDDISTIKLKLQTKLFYKVKVTCVKDGKNVLGQDGMSRYGKPFDINSSSVAASVGEGLVAHKTVGFKSIELGETLLKGESRTYKRPICDRYYGETGLIYCDKQTDFALELKRVVFALKINAKITQGRIKVAVDGAAEVEIPAQDAKQIVYTMQGGIAGEWMKDDYKEKVAMMISYQAQEGQEWTQIGSVRELELVRRHVYPINVDDAGLSGVAITLEQEQLIEQSPISW